MEYVINQKIFSLSDSFYIKDINGNDVYKVKGKLFSIGNKLAIEDLNGNQLLFIKQQLLKFLPQYNIYYDSNCIAKVKKQLSFFNSKFDISSIYGEFTIKGDIFSHDFEIFKNGFSAAHVYKKFFSISDSYIVDISASQDVPFILALVIIIDQVLFDNRNNS